MPSIPHLRKQMGSRRDGMMRKQTDSRRDGMMRKRADSRKERTICKWERNEE